MHQRFRPVIPVLAVFFVALLFADGLAASQIQARYSAAVGDFNALADNAERGSRRDLWEKLAARFGALSREAGVSLDGAKAAFMEARSFGELALRSGSRADFTRAEGAYARVAERFARTAQAPEALHRRAQILDTHLGRPAEAASVLNALLKRYPNYAQARDAAELQARLGGVSAQGAGAAPVRSFAPAGEGKPDPARAAKVYESAARDWRVLIRDRNRGARREPWLDLERRFLQALALDPVGETGGKARFQAARCMEELADRSQGRNDWQASVDHYLALARDFPKNSLADDALFQAAYILDKRLDDPQAARRTAQRVLDDYPKGDMVRNAKGLLASLPKRTEAEAARPGTRSVTGQADNAASAMQALPGRASALTGISQRGNAKRTALTLELNGAASFRYQFLAASGDGAPARIQVDIDGVAAGKAVKSAMTFAKRPVRAVRVVPLASRDNPGTRVVVELGKIRQYTVDTSVSPPGITVQCSTGTDLAGGKAPPEQGKNGPVTQGMFSGVSSAKPGTLLEQLGLAVRTIMIDAGHGGKDPGAMHGGVRESDITLTLARLLGERLKTQGFSVLYTRTRDIYVPLDQRAVLANEKKADLFISLHVNASKDKNINGLETYFLDLARSSSAATVAARENAVSVKSISDLQFILTDLMLTSKLQESHDLATLLHGQMHGRVRRAGFTVNDNGVRSAPFYVLMGARMPAALVEIGYLTNESDAKRIASARYLERLADGLAQGVVEYKNKLNRFNR